MGWIKKKQKICSKCGKIFPTNGAKYVKLCEECWNEARKGTKPHHLKIRDNRITIGVR